MILIIKCRFEQSIQVCQASFSYTNVCVQLKGSQACTWLPLKQAQLVIKHSPLFMKQFSAALI